MIIPNEEIQFLIHVVTAAMENKPFSIGEEIDWTKTANYLKRNQLMGLACIGSGKAENKEKIPPSLMQKMQRSYRTCIIMEAQQHIAMEEIRSAFQKNGLAFLPLKGSVLKYEYPQPQFRKMCDLDILFHDEDREKIDQTLIDLGYEREYQGEKDISYTKKPYINIEMHFHLLNDDMADNGYFDHIWERSVPVSEGSWEYKMTWEDFYLFLLMHLAKHLTIGGSGFRSLTDFHVFYKNKYQLMDQDFLNKKLEELHLKKLEAVLIQLDQCLFGGQPWEDEALYDIFQYIIESGIYGTAKNLGENLILRSEKQVDNFSRVKWFFKAAFPRREKIIKYYPWMQKHHYPYPVIWLRLSFERIFFQRKAVLMVTKAMSVLDTGQLHKTQKLFEKMGLENFRVSNAHRK